MMTYSEIYQMVRDGAFSDRKGKWKITKNDIKQLTSTEILRLRSLASERKEFFTLLANEQEAAEKAGRKYTPPPGVPDVVFRGQALEYEMFLDEFLSVAKAKKAVRTVNAPSLLNNWFPKIASDSVYKDDHQVVDLTRVWKAANSMKKDIENVLKAQIERGQLVFITHDNQKAENGHIVACAPGEKCGLTQDEIYAGAFYGFVTEGMLTEAFAGLSEPSGEPYEQAKAWARRIVGAIRNEPTVFPKVIARSLVNAAPVLPEFPMYARGEEVTQYRKEVDDEMKRATKRLKAELNSIDKAICAGIDEAFAKQLGGTAFRSSRASKMNAVASWIRCCSRIPGSVYSFYASFISGRKLSTDLFDFDTGKSLIMQQ